jgi:enamine deaminase RidA (YjgF/YER057c/UK114 family)
LEYERMTNRRTVVWMTLPILLVPLITGPIGSIEFLIWLALLALWLWALLFWSRRPTEDQLTRLNGTGAGKVRLAQGAHVRMAANPTTSVELVRAATLSSEVPYAYAAIAPPGSLVFTAGACPLNDDGMIIAPGDVAAQAARAMANLGAALAASGCTLTDVAKSTVYVASPRRDDLVGAWHVVREAFGDHDAPSTLLGVAVLGYPDQLVEIEAIAVRP